MKISIEFEEGDELTRSGFEFLAGRDGQSLAEYTKEALLNRLAADEDAQTGQGYFENLRGESRS